MMIPVEANALLINTTPTTPATEVQDPAKSLPKELFIAHILPQLNEVEYVKAHLVSRQWSVITEDFRTSLVNRALCGAAMTAEQWLIIAQKNQDLAELVATIYSFIKKSVEFTPANQLNLVTDRLNIDELIKNIAQERKLSTQDLQLLNLFLNSVFCFCFERICSIEEWQEAFFDEVLANNIAMSGLIGVAVNAVLTGRLDQAESVEEFKQDLLEDVRRGDSAALTCYGYLCEIGDETLGIEKDGSKALHYYKLAAQNACGIIQYYLGCCHVNGHLVEKNINKAMEWFIRATKEDNLAAFISIAHSFLAYCYGKGLCGEPNSKKAFEHMQLSAKNNSSLAELYLGFCYASGYGVEQDWNEAFVSLGETAARFEDPFAFLALGCCFLGGKGVEQSASEAANCFMCVWKLLEMDELSELEMDELSEDD